MRLLAVRALKRVVLALRLAAGALALAIIAQQSDDDG